MYFNQSRLGYYLDSRAACFDMRRGKYSERNRSMQQTRVQVNLVGSRLRGGRVARFQGRDRPGILRYIQLGIFLQYIRIETRVSTIDNL